MKLYLIGNGFDLAHKLPTKYSSFIDSNPEKYEKYYGVFKGQDWNHIEKTIGDKILNKKEEIEELINRIDADEIAEEIISSYGTNEYGEIEYYGYEHEELGELFDDLNELTELIESFEEDFKQYLKDNISYNFISISSLANCIEQNSIFISFNYTSTLEKVYGINDVKHIHGNLDDRIKIGYNSEISKFDMTLGNLDYPKFEDIIVHSKHDLPDRQRYYEDVEDDEGHYTGEVVVARQRYEFHNRVSADINLKKNNIQTRLFINDKSKFAARISVMKSIESILFDEIIILGHSLGEMDHDFLDELFPRSKIIKCDYYDENDLKRKQEIAKNKNWDIEFLKI